MNIIKSLTFLALTGAIAFSPAIYANEANKNMSSNNETSKSMVSNDSIVSTIKSRLADNKTTADLKDVKITSQSGIVNISGHVNTDEEASKLIEIADSTNGVRDIDASQLMVKESKQPLTDTIITAKIKGIYAREKLFGDKDISMTGVTVETTNGIVYLTGSVENQEEANNAVKLAKTISGVKNVDSKLEVKSAS